MKKVKLVTVIGISLLSVLICQSAMGDQAKLEQSQKTLENQKLSDQDRETAYIALLNLDLQGFKVASNLLANGNISADEWIKWTYDYQTRFEGGETEKKFENFLYGRIEKSTTFANTLAKRFGDAGLNDQTAFEYLKDNATGLRRLGFLILQGRYSHLPSFDYRADDVVRAKQLEVISAFLKSKGK